MIYQRINIALVSILILLFLVSIRDPHVSSSVTNGTKRSAPTIIVPTSTPTPTPPFPVRIAIPKLGINAAVEPVENDEYGTMQLPQETDKVGWYYHGFKPGEKGNAVIGGHLDLVTGAPAIFYRLNELNPGDAMEVMDEHGIKRIFLITNTQIYPYDETPIKTIFGNSEKAQLNLITCAGIFDQNTHNYLQRLIIYSELSH